MLLEIHPDNPQQRLIKQAVDVINQGGVIAYPTDSAYALGCHLSDKDALQRIRKIRQVDKNHFFTIVCKDLSELATYAIVDNWVFRLLKSHTPGAYTFLLKATHEVPKMILHAKRKTIGMRIPDNAIVQSLLGTLEQPIMSTTLILANANEPLADPYDIEAQLGNQVDLIIDGGNCSLEPTSVIDLTGNCPEIIRQGKGDTTLFT